MRGPVQRSSRFSPIVAVVVIMLFMIGMIAMRMNVFQDTDIIQTQTPAPSGGTLYYVSTRGSDNNPGTESQPFQTFERAADALQPGDTLLVYPGTYTQGLADVIPSGKDWSLPVTIKAFNPNNRPVLIPRGGTYPDSDYVLFFSGAEREIHHVIVDGFVLDGRYIARDVVKIESGAHHIRLINSELKNAPGQGLLITGADSQFNEFSNLHVHHVGFTDFNHGVYISTSNNIFENSEVNNNAGWGIQVYNEHEWTCDNNIIRNNEVYNNGQSGARGAGIGLYSGTGHVAYNNVVWNNSGGIIADYNATAPKIYNNTVYRNNHNGTEYNIFIGSQAFDAEVYNNIIVGQVTGLYSAAVTTTIAKNNLFFDNDEAILDVMGTLSTMDNMNGDPLFINVQSSNFRIRVGGAGIDKGLTLSDMVDKDGTPITDDHRDIGAYEFSSDR